MNRDYFDRYVKSYTNEQYKKLIDLLKKDHIKVITYKYKKNDYKSILFHLIKNEEDNKYHNIIVKQNIEITYDYIEKIGYVLIKYDKDICYLINNNCELISNNLRNNLIKDLEEEAKGLNYLREILFE